MKHILQSEIVKLHRQSYNTKVLIWTEWYILSEHRNKITYSPSPKILNGNLFLISHYFARWITIISIQNFLEGKYENFIRKSVVRTTSR